MDQIVVHLSINHATLPRIQIFLANLQTATIGLQMPVDRISSTMGSKTPKSKSTQDDDEHPTITSRDRSKSKGRWRYKSWHAIKDTISTKSTTKAPSISEHPLRLQPEQGIELSTTVYTGDGESTRSNGQQQSYGPATLPNEGLARDETRGGVRVHKEIKMAYDRA